MADPLSPSILNVLVAGLNLRDRVQTGDRPHLGTEQARLKVLLNDVDRRQAVDANHSVDTGQSYAGANRQENFLGVRYAMACWLDELMIEAGWREWDENKLEQSLYRTNMRYSNFWQQSRYAESDPAGFEAQSAFLLCTLLGFRGELGESPEQLREYVSTTRGRIAKQMGREPAALPEKSPISEVPPLMGIEQYRKMTRWLVGAILVAVPIGAFLLVVLFR